MGPTNLGKPEEVVEKMTKELKKRNEAKKEEMLSAFDKPQPLKRKYNKLGRNELCYCGSGKKWKHCHMKAEAQFVNELERKKDGSTS